MGGFGGGEPELAIAIAGRAAGMLVIIDRGFPGVALWKAYTQAGAHLLIRARLAWPAARCRSWTTGRTWRG